MFRCGNETAYSPLLIKKQAILIVTDTLPVIILTIFYVCICLNSLAFRHDFAFFASPKIRGCLWSEV